MYYTLQLESILQSYQGFDIILQGYYITDRRKSENYKKITNMNSTKDAHEFQKENLRAKHERLEEKNPGRSNVDPLRYSCTTLINRESTTVQAL